MFSQPSSEILKHLHTKMFSSSSQICGLHTNRIEELMRAFLADVFAKTRYGLSASTFNVTQREIKYSQAIRNDWRLGFGQLGSKLTTATQMSTVSQRTSHQVEEKKKKAPQQTRHLIRKHVHTNNRDLPVIVHTPEAGEDVSEA